MNDRDEFDYDRNFLPYLRGILFDAYGIPPTMDFHPEQINQVLKDQSGPESRSLFCFLDVQFIPEADAQRLRVFTQEQLHRVLLWPGLSAE